MKRNPPRLHVGRIVVAGLFVALVAIVYLYSAYAPTGYRTFETDHADALKRVDEFMGSQAAATPDVQAASRAENERPGVGGVSPSHLPVFSPSRGPAEASSPDSTPTLSTVDVENVVFLPDGSWRLIVSGEVEFTRAFRETGLWQLEILLPNRLAIAAGSGRFPLWNPANLPEDSRPSSAGLKFAEPRFADLDFASDFFPNHALVAALYNDAMPGFALPSAFREIAFSRSESVPRDPAERQVFHAILDAAERLLWNNRSVEVYSCDSPFYYRRGRAIVDLAILRLALRGENEKASGMLRTLVESRRLDHLRRFPRGLSESEGDFRNLAYLFWRLGEVETFPNSALDEAQRILDSARLSPAQMEDFRAAHAFRCADAWRESLARGLDYQRNTWNYFYDGAPQRLVSRAMMPVLQRRIDKLALAWARGDAQGIWTGETGLEPLGRVMNADLLGDYRWAFCRATKPARRAIPLPGNLDPDEPDGAAFFSLFFPVLSAEYSGAAMNDELDMTRLVLASIRFWRAEKRYPETIRELVERGYLADTGFLRERFKKTEADGTETVERNLWAIRWIEPFSFALYPPDRQSPLPMPDGAITTPFGEAMTRYRAKHRRDPVSVEELAPYLPAGTDLEEFRDRFMRVGPMPVFCRFELDLDNSRALEAISPRIARRKRLTDDTRAELERLKNSAPQCVTVFFTWPPLEPIRKDLREFLTEQPERDADPSLGAPEEDGNAKPKGRED